MKIDLHDIEKCEACGAEHVKGIVACSLFGAYSGTWCEKCLRDDGRDSYNLMVDYIAATGRWPDDINEIFQAEVRRQLKLHEVPEEVFKFDVEKTIEEEQVFIYEYYKTKRNEEVLPNDVENLFS